MEFLFLAAILGAHFMWVPGLWLASFWPSWCPAATRASSAAAAVLAAFCAASAVAVSLTTLPFELAVAPGLGLAGVPGVAATAFWLDWAAYAALLSRSIIGWRRRTRRPTEELVAELIGDRSR